MRTLLILTLLFQLNAARADGLFGKNKAGDSFAVKAVEASQATLEGTPEDLKVGDTLYFTRSPFKFTVTGIKGNQVTVALPPSHSLTVGAALLRYSNDNIKKNMQTESKLKQALED